MAASRDSVEQIVEALVEWRDRHRVSDTAVRELLTNLMEVKGNASFMLSTTAIRRVYLQRQEPRENA